MTFVTMKVSAMHKSRLLNETTFLLVISLLLLVSQGFVA
ncbi:two-component sensor histidine kinase, partial [Enterococcus faecium]